MTYTPRFTGLLEGGPELYYLVFRNEGDVLHMTMSELLTIDMKWVRERTLTFPTCSSSVRVKEVAFFPAKILLPSAPLTPTSAAGPWQTADTIFPD